MSTNRTAHTRTGNFPIGFRRGGSEWQKDLPGLLVWARENGFGVVDLGRSGDREGALVGAQGLRLGSVDLLEWQPLISPDKGKREASLKKNADYIKACAAFGEVNHFIVMLPENPELPAPDNFSYMVESFTALAKVLEANRAKLVIEGWPGPGSLCCTPEGYGELFRLCPSPALGVNYDPSHLIRLGIDPLRFLREFAGRVYHVHGKDTLLSAEGSYRYGSLKPIFAKPPAFGAMNWRYTIPGHGLTPWTEVFQILSDAKYRGAVSVELEDASFHGSPEKEKEGLLFAKRFLEGC